MELPFAVFGVAFIIVGLTNYLASTGFGVILLIIGIVLTAFGFRKSSQYFCGYCDFTTIEEKELDEHMQVCEKYQNSKNVKDNEINELRERIKKLEDKKTENS